MNITRLLLVRDWGTIELPAGVRYAAPASGRGASASRSDRDSLVEHTDNPIGILLPVVILTNYSEPDLLERGKQLRIIAYIVKAETTPGQVADRVREFRDSLGG